MLAAIRRSETPTRTNHVSELLLLGTSTIRDELLPAASRFLTAHLSRGKTSHLGPAAAPAERARRWLYSATSWRPISLSQHQPAGQKRTLQLCRSRLPTLSPLERLVVLNHSPSKNPERAALYFVSGVCVGLVLTLVALVMRISCYTDCRRRPTRRTFLQDRESSSGSSDSEDGGSDTASDLSVRRHRRFERTLNKNVFTSAEELERAQRLEERERIIREIWMNGQPEVPGTRNLNCYY
ncbi:substance-P receptor isoform X3 [Tenrec ecaudatus]|uniref:substance-P receptor isoform X3 n=1 Tax=Tenrec ecaudatus TaxID=94439 RepID=UPI003F59E1EA